MPNSNPVKWAVVTDFDGTVTLSDIGDAISLHFKAATRGEIRRSYGPGVAVEKWMTETFSRVKASPAEIRRFVLKNPVMRRGFDRFAAECARLNIPLEIVSGGLDIYINPLLRRWKITPSKLYCAAAKRSQNGFTIRYPHLKNTALDRFKALRVKRLKSKNRRVIFCGDGPNDLPAARAADVAFASGRLYRLCRASGVKAARLSDFNAVAEMIK